MDSILKYLIFFVIGYLFQRMFTNGNGFTVSENECVVGCKKNEWCLNIQNWEAHNIKCEDTEKYDESTESGCCCNSPLVWGPGYDYCSDPMSR